jgi:hypothetical protein
MKPAKPPRADVLWYPRYRWATVLVRRTHDLDLARELAEQRWADTLDDRPLVGSRIGWWTTYVGRTVPASAAEDQAGRIVQICDERARAACPGIEFRP